MSNDIIMNMRTNGSITKNHATGVAPALHMRFNIHVQKRTYKNLMTKIIDVFGTAHDLYPKKYWSVFP